MRTRLRVSLAIVIFGVLSGVLYVYLMWWIPNQKMRDADWCVSASRDEIRRVCHRVIRTPWGNHHDAFILLQEVGDADSIPLLIRALQWQKPAGEKGFMVCTTVHCLDALRSLTGHDAGRTFLAWDQWWKETGSKLPANEFYPRQEKRKSEAVTRPVQVTPDDLR